MKNLIRNCLYLAVVSITVAGSVLSTSAAEEVSIAGFPSAVIKQPNAEYVESTVDLQVKVLGGDVALNRTWANGRWHVNPNWASLRFVADPLGQSIQSVDRSGAIYKRTGDAGVYQFEQYYLQKIASGWRWYDVQGNWIHYDDQGRITEYGDRNDISVHFIRDAEGRLTNINDHNGQLVYQFTYDAQERLTNVRDRANRVVTYQWTGDLLTKVTDVLGNDWVYGYNKDGQLNERHEPDGGVIKVEYDVSVPAGKLAMVSGKNYTSQSPSEVTLGSTPRDFKPARVGKIINKTGAVTLVNTRYDNVKKTYLITVTDPMGKQTETLSNSQGHMLSQKVNGVLQSKVEYEGKYRRLYTDARGLTTTIDYSTTQKPVKVLYADGTSETYEYSSHYDLLTRYVNAKGITTAFSYDAKGNLLQSIEAVGTPVERKVTYQYDHYGQLVEVTLGEDQNQRTLIQKYDVNGNKIQLVDSKGNEYQFTADVMGNVTSATNPLSANWSYQYNLAGHLTEVKNPLNQQAQYQVDFAGRITNYQDPLQHSTQLAYSFDSVGTQRSITNALGETNRDHYNLVGDLIQTQSPTGLMDEQRYNLDGRLNQVIDVMGNITALTYGTTDAMTGMLAEVKYPTYRETYGYNEKGQVTSVTQWLDDTEKQTTLMSYDELGQLVAEVLPGNRTTQIIYDELGNTVQQTDAMGGITSQKWNIFGELVEVTNANGHTHRFTYDANSNLIEENNPTSGITQYEYDAANQLIKKVNAKGDKTTYHYDLAGNLLVELTTASDSATLNQIVTYIYNAAGQLVDVKQTGDTHSHYQYSMDALGRTTEEIVTYGTGSDAITKKLGYGYDQENRLSSFKYPEGSELQYHYDKANLKSTQLANGESIEWKNYQWFSPTEINTPNAKQQNQYDALMRPISIQVNANNGQNAQNPLMKRDYQYNSAGNITSRNTEKGKVDYRYDQLDRLIEATPDASLQAIGLPNEGYTYDAIGNRLGSRHQPGSWQYNGQDQLMSWGTGSQAETLSYTATGQLKQNKKALETLDYDYDATDRLTEVKRNNITLANYQYDPFGRRMSKEVNGERTYYLYSDEGLIAELNAQGNTEVAYGWMPDSTWGTNPLWQANLTTGQTLKNAAYHYLHTDHLGTPQIATNQAGNITWQAEAEAFGETHLNESNQITMNLRFPGQYYDAETDTHYNYFRDYNPRTGRYQQSDPIGLEGGINYYGYVAGNPLKYYDPKGELLQFLGIPIYYWIVGGGAAVVGGTIIANNDPIPAPKVPDARRNLGLTAMFTLAPTILWHLNDSNDGDQCADDINISSQTTSAAGDPNNNGKDDKDKKDDSLTTEQKKSIRKLEKNIREHQDKLDDFKKNPTVRPGMERAPEAKIREQQMRRVKHLEDEIRAFRKEINDIRSGVKELTPPKGRL